MPDEKKNEKDRPNAPRRQRRTRQRAQRGVRFPLGQGLMLALSLLAGIPALAQEGQGTGQPPTPNTQRPTPDAPVQEPAPPTGLQALLPQPLSPQPDPKKPLRASPRLIDLTGRKATGPLTINDVVTIALSTNRSLALANETLTRARSRTSETRAAFNPNLSAGFTYTRLNQGQTATFGATPTTTTTTTGGTGTGTTGTTTGTDGTGTTTTGGTTATTGGQTIAIVNADQPVFNATVSLPIDIAGQLRTAVQQAQFQEVAARIDVNRTRNQIVLDVKSAFYDVLRAQAQVRVAADALQNAQDRLIDAQKKFRAGVVARFDVIRAQTDVDNARQTLIVARTQVSVNIATLNNTIGLDVNTPLQLADTGAVENPPGVAPPADLSADVNALPNLPADQNPPENTDTNRNPTANLDQGQAANTPVVVTDPLILGPEYSSVLAEALANRPEILESDAQIAAARKGITLARRSLQPTLALSVGGSYSPNAAGFSPQTTSGNLVLSLSVPIFDGGATRARVDQARADANTQEINRRQTVDAVSLEVRQAYLTLLQARDRVAVANSGLSQAREGYRLARVRYNAGVSATAGISPLLELSDAQAALTQAESNQVNALYDYNNARTRLDKAAGRYSYLNGSSGYAAPPGPKVTGAEKNGVRK